MNILLIIHGSTEIDALVSNQSLRRLNIDRMKYREIDRGNIQHVHQILDSTNTLFISRLLDDGNDDLVIRALHSTEGMIIVDPLNTRVEWRLAKALQTSELFVAPRMLDTKGVRHAEYNFGPGTGNIKGRYLIVGERPGNEASLGQRDAAFFSVSGSSAWLRNQIFSIDDLHPDDFYFINAFDRENNPTDLSFIEGCAFERIFALGGVAKEHLSKEDHLKDKVSNHYHPQYWKRFRSKEEYPLITELKGTE